MINEVTGPVPGEVPQMLAAAGLPGEDIAAVDWFAALLWLEEDAIVAFAGLERCGMELLLRSVVTRPGFQGRGIAGRLVARLCEMAGGSDRRRIYLLTTGAQDYFGGRHGFASVDRALAPEDIRRSAEYSSLCPDDAVLMSKRL